MCLGLRVKDYFNIRTKFPGQLCVLTVHAHYDPGLCVSRSACQRLLQYTHKIPRSVVRINSSRALIGCKDVQLDKISFVFYCFAFGTHTIQAPSLGLQIF